MACALTTVASLKDDAHLLGTDAKSTAKVNQWISFADDELFNQAIPIFFMFAGILPYNEGHEARAWGNLDRSLSVLEGHVANRTFVVGGALTLADISLAANLNSLFTKFVGADWRAKFPATVRYFQNMIAQPPIAATFPKEQLLEETIKYSPK